jgi:hypothetical protein
MVQVVIRGGLMLLLAQRAPLATDRPQLAAGFIGGGFALARARALRPTAAPRRRFAGKAPVSSTRRDYLHHWRVVGVKGCRIVGLSNAGRTSGRRTADLCICRSLMPSTTPCRSVGVGTGSADGAIAPFPHWLAADGSVRCRDRRHHKPGPMRQPGRGVPPDPSHDPGRLEPLQDTLSRRGRTAQKPRHRRRRTATPGVDRSPAQRYTAVRVRLEGQQQQCQPVRWRAAACPSSQ